MKTLSLLSLLAISTCALACVGAPESDIDGDQTDGVEQVSEAQDPLTVTTTMGTNPWGNQTPYTQDLVLAHRVSNVYNKWAAVTSFADFPSIVGLSATAANVDMCTSSSIDVYVYKRASGSSTWTSIDHQKRMATATVSGGKITACQVTFTSPYCTPYTFGGFDAEMEVDLIAAGGDGTQGRKTNVVQYQSINLANCP